MSGMSHLEPKFRGMRRNQQITVKVEEKRLQRLLDFIDSRMQDQRSKLKRQIEDTQQTAEEMEEKRHKATLQLLKNYFEVTSGRVKGNSSTNSIHEERMLGVLSEPSLATVPEVDPDILSKPRSMYDRITRTLDTSRLPLIAPRNRNIITQSQSQSLPNSIPNSNRSDDGSVVVSASPRSTPRNTNSPTDSTEESQWSDPKKPVPIRKEHYVDKLNQLKSHRKDGEANQNNRVGETYHNNRVSSHAYRNGLSQHTEQYDTLNGHEYQKGQLKPTSRMNLFIDDETPTPRLLGDTVQSKNGLSRHSSLRRPINRDASMSTMSLSELQMTRKQKAASKLKHALKNIRVPR